MAASSWRDGQSGGTLLRSEVPGQVIIEGRLRYVHSVISVIIIAFIKVFIRVLANLHDCVEYFIAPRLHRNLDLFLQFLNLVQRIVKLHLQVVTLEYH